MLESEIKEEKGRGRWSAAERHRRRIVDVNGAATYDSFLTKICQV
jgi:hypothetical protein